MLNDAACKPMMISQQKGKLLQSSEEAFPFFKAFFWLPSIVLHSQDQNGIPSVGLSA